MTMVYYGIGGDDSTGDGSLGNPYLNYDAAVSNSISGDTVALVNSQTLLRHPTAGYTFDDDRLVGSESYRGGTLAAADSAPQSAAATSATLAEANNPFIIDGIRVDGEGSSGPDNALMLAEQSAGEAVETRLNNVEIVSGAVYGLLINDRAGRQDINNIKLSGDLGARFIGATGSLSAKGNQVININSLHMAPNEITGSKKVIELSKADSAVNTLDIVFKGMTGVVNIGAGAIVDLVDLKNVDSTVLSNFDLTINAENASNVIGLLVRGRSAANPLSDGKIINGTMRYNCPTGFGVAYGQSTTDNFMTSGEVSAVNIIGKFYPAPSTPHNAVMGQGSTGDLRGGYTQDGYVGWLFSINTFTASGVLAYDCYGPSFYMKGVVSGALEDCTAVVSGKYTQRDRGVLAVAPQGASDTVALSVNRNTVIVSDIAKIHSLAYLEDALQLATFSNNTYIIPDTVDLDTELLFSYHNGMGGAANQTIAQWNANTEVTNDMIVQIPKGDIDQIIQGLNPAESVSGSIRGSAIRRGSFGW